MKWTFDRVKKCVDSARILWEHKVVNYDAFMDILQDIMYTAWWTLEDYQKELRTYNDSH